MKVLFSNGSYDFLLLDCGHTKFRYRYSQKHAPRCKECYELHLYSLARKLGLKLLPGKNVLKHYQTRDFRCVNCNKTIEVYTSTIYNGTAKCRCRRVKPQDLNN